MTTIVMIFVMLAFTLFGLTTHEHHRKWLGKPLAPAQTKRMRACAWGALMAAFPPAISAQGWVYGPILWVACIMMGAGVVFLALNFLPGRGVRRSEGKK